MRSYGVELFQGIKNEMKKMLRNKDQTEEWISRNF